MLSPYRVTICDGGQRTQKTQKTHYPVSRKSELFAVLMERCRSLYEDILVVPPEQPTLPVDDWGGLVSERSVLVEFRAPIRQDVIKWLTDRYNIATEAPGEMRKLLIVPEDNAGKQQVCLYVLTQDRVVRVRSQSVGYFEIQKLISDGIQLFGGGTDNGTAGGSADGDEAGGGAEDEVAEGEGEVSETLSPTVRPTPEPTARPTPASETSAETSEAVPTDSSSTAPTTSEADSEAATAEASEAVPTDTSSTAPTPEPAAAPTETLATPAAFAATSSATQAATSERSPSFAAFAPLPGAATAPAVTPAASTSGAPADDSSGDPIDDSSTAPATPLPTIPPTPLPTASPTPTPLPAFAQLPGLAPQIPLLQGPVQETPTPNIGIGPLDSEVRDGGSLRYMTINEVGGGRFPLFAPDVFCVVEGPKTAEFKRLKYTAPTGVRDKEELENIILGSDIYSYNRSLDYNDTLVFKNITSIYRLYKDGFMEYNYIPLTQASEKGSLPAALEHAVASVLNIERQLLGSADLILSGVYENESDLTYRFTFDYIIDDFPVYFQYSQKQGDSAVTYRNAITVIANGTRTVSCRWMLVDLFFASETRSMQMYFDQIEVGQSLTKMAVSDIGLAYSIDLSGSAGTRTDTGDGAEDENGDAGDENGGAAADGDAVLESSANEWPVWAISSPDGTMELVPMSEGQTEG
ncbi:MAG: hypothetical protein LBU58_00330 [Clostridiales bacterium]|nr:hypothetical protein [Clostridiales bacterium]